jgi:hypothetical protein
MLPLHVDLKLTPPPTQQGASQASPAGVVEIWSSPLSAAPATAPQSPMSNSSRGPPSSPGSPFAFQALFLSPRQSPQQSTTQTQTTPQQQQPTAQKRKRKQPVGKSSTFGRGPNCFIISGGHCTAFLLPPSSHHLQQYHGTIVLSRLLAFFSLSWCRWPVGFVHMDRLGGGFQDIGWMPR